MCSRYATHDASAKPARIATDRWGKGLEPVTRCIDLAFERPERGSGTIQGLAPVHNRLLRNALIAFTVADLIPAAVLALTFYPPFVQRLAWLAAAACALTALSLDSHQFGRKLAFYLPLIALFVFCGGEEISWGQRLLHYQTPAWLASNKQHEINLHDIGSISVNENAFFVFTTLCCLVGPWLLARAPAWRVYLRRLNAPIMDPVVAQVYGIGLAAWVVVGVRFGTLGFSPLSLWGYYTQMDDEIWEFYAALGFCALTALDLAHRLAESRRMRVPASYAQRTAPTLRGASNSSEARNSGRPVHPTPIAAAAPRRRFSEIREQ